MDGANKSLVLATRGCELEGWENSQKARYMKLRFWNASRYW